MNHKQSLAAIEGAADFTPVESQEFAEFIYRDQLMISFAQLHPDAAQQFIASIVAFSGEQLNVFGVDDDPVFHTDKFQVNYEKTTFARQ